MAEKKVTPHKGKAEPKSAQSAIAAPAGGGFRLEDNRAESQIQLRLKEGMDARALSAPDLTGSKPFSIQKKSVQPNGSPAANPVVASPDAGGPVQLAGKKPDEQEAQAPAPLPQETAQFAGAGEASPPPPAGSSSNGGLPQQLKSGVEQLSGQSMSDVKVHANSEKPAQLNAHAYAQGSDIHIGPGQEKHLPHEAWHVAQQKQGRVQPTKQLKGKVPVNDDKGLEQEADVMGAKALEVGVKAASGIMDQSPLTGNAMQFAGEGEVPTEAPQVQSDATETATVSEDVPADVVPEPEETVADQLQNLLAATPPPKYSQKAFIITTDSLRKIKESGKAYEGLKAEQKASESVPKSSSWTDMFKKKESTPDQRIAEILEKGEVEEKAEGPPSMAEKFKSFFGFGKKTNLKLSPELSPKKFQFPTGIPVKIDPSNRLAGWAAVKVDMDAVEKYSTVNAIRDGEKIWGNLRGLLKTDNSEGYFPFKKLAVTDLDLNITNGIRITDRPQTESQPSAKGESAGPEKSKGKADPSLMEKVGKKVVSTLSGYEGVANWANAKIDQGTDKFNEAIDLAKEKAKDIDVLKNVVLEAPSGGTRLIPGQGFFTSLTGGYDFGIEGVSNKFTLTPSLMVNIRDSSDWFVEYRGTQLEVPSFTLGSEDTIKVNVDLGTLTHQPNQAGSIFKSTGAEASVTFLNQTLGVKLEEASFDTAASASKFTYKISEFSGNLNILGTNVQLKVEEPSFNDGKLDFKKASGEIPELIPFEGVKFSEVKAAMLKNEDKSKNIGGTAKFGVTNKHIQEASGKLDMFKKGTGAADVILSDGKLKAVIFGQTLQLDGVSYDSSKEPGVVHLEQGKLSLDIANPVHNSNITGEFAIQKASLSSGSFTYEKASAKVDDIEVGSGISFKDIQAGVSKSEDEDEFHASGSLHVNHKSVTASGQIKISKKGANDLVFSLVGGKLEADVFGSKLKAQDVYYSSADNSLGAATVAADIPLPLPTGTVNKKLEFTEPKLKDGQFSFGKIELSLGDLEPMTGVRFKDVSADVQNVREKLVYNGKATLDVTRGPIRKAEGTVTIGMSGADPYFYVQKGSVRGSVLGGTDNLVATGINYSHANKNRFSMASAKVDKIMVLGSEVGFVLVGARYDDESGFNFDKATATLDEIALTSDIKARNIALSIEKKGEDDYRIVSDGEFMAGGSLYGLTMSTSGRIIVTKDGGEPASAELLNAGMKLSGGGQSFEMNNVSYQDGLFSAASAKADFMLPFTDEGHKLSTQVKNLSIGNGDFTFSEATVNPNLSVDFGIASARLTELKLQRNAVGNKVFGSGAISVGGGTILGKEIPQLSGIGTVSHQFKKGGEAGTTEKNLVGVEGKLPAFNLPKDMLPSGLWPLGMSLPIPVAPGLQVKIYAGVGGGLESKDTAISLVKKNDTTYTFGAHARDLTLSLDARVGAGLEAGNPFVASVMVGVEAEGKIAARANLDFTKDFSVGTAEKLDIPADDVSAFSYKVDGGITLAANLVFQATALFFLSKKWTKTLAVKELGSFEKENGKEWVFKAPEKPLRPTDEELMKDVSSNLPASLKGKSKDELNELGQQKRFNDQTTKDVVAVFKETENTQAKPVQLFDFGTFNYNRFDWAKIQAVLPVIIDKVQETDTPDVEIDAPMPAAAQSTGEDAAATGQVKTAPGWFEGFKKAGSAVQAELSYSKALQDLGNAMNSKKDFIDSYDSSARELTSRWSRFRESNPELQRIVELHLALAAIYLEANNDLKRKVHSSILGDNAQQRIAQMRRFFGARGLKESGQKFMTKIEPAKAKYTQVKQLEKAYMSKSDSAVVETPEASGSARP